MVRKVILGFVLLGVCGFAAAEESKASGGYLGGAFGFTTFDDDGAFLGLGVDDSDSSLMINGGYKILKHLAVEARYVDLGSYSVAGTGLSLDASAFSIHAIGIIPFGDSGWELFGQLGLGTLTVDIAGSDFDEDVGAAGIGVRFSPTENFSLAIQTDVYAWEDTSTGFVFDMSVGGTQFAAQFIF